MIDAYLSDNNLLDLPTLSAFSTSGLPLTSSLPSGAFKFGDDKITIKGPKDQPPLVTWQWGIRGDKSYQATIATEDGKLVYQEYNYRQGIIRGGPTFPNCETFALTGLKGATAELTTLLLLRDPKQPDKEEIRQLLILINWFSLITAQ